jgi:hypothetical protein
MDMRLDETWDHKTAFGVKFLTLRLQGAGNRGDSSVLNADVDAMELLALDNARATNNQVHQSTAQR